MAIRLSSAITKPVAVAAIFVAATWLGGCNWIDGLRGDNFTDEFAHWGENQRPPTSPGQMYGFSTEARQVERNLGVQ